MKEEELAKWWCAFNSWEWAEDFPFEKPPWFEDAPQYSDKTIATKYWATRGFMEAIEEIVDKEVLLGYWRDK